MKSISGRRKRSLFLVLFVCAIVLCGCGSSQETHDTDDNIKTVDIDYSDVNDNCTYIANINSNIFHRKQCIYVAKTGEENKIFLNCDRCEVLDVGYIPCKKCCP